MIYNLLYMYKNKILQFSSYLKISSLIIILIAVSLIWGVYRTAYAASECVNWQTSHPDWVFCDDFELGNKDKWNQVAGKATVNGARAYSGNYSLHIPYEDLIPPPPATDINRFAQIDLSSQNLEHFFVRGYVNFASEGTYAEQRKLYYIFGKNWGTDVGWDVITSAWYRNTPFRHQVNSNGYSWSGLRVPSSDTKKDNVFNFDTWYALELEVKLNSSPTCDTTGACDGLVRVWVNDILQLERTNIKIRNNTEPLGNVRVGAQADDTDFIVDEDRYWDNVVVSRSRIGMYGNPPPPVVSPPSAENPPAEVTPPLTEFTPTATPIKLSASATSNQVNLTWPAVKGATVYRIYNQNNIQLDASTGTTFTHSKLNPNTSYTYTVRAHNATSNDIASATKTVTTKGVKDVIQTLSNEVTPVAEVAGCNGRTSGFNTTTGKSCGATSSVSSASYNFGTTTLRNGSRGEGVRELQRFLNNVLNLGLATDGILGPKTIAVIRKWQSDNGLVPDGLVGPLTKARMEAVAGLSL